MSIEQLLLEDMKLAMKSGNKIELDTIRMLRAQIQTSSIAKKDTLDEDEVVQVLQKEAKKRKEAIEMYQQGKREDLVNKERQEIEIISKYLPEQLSDAEIDRIIKDSVKSIGAESEKDMGRVMGDIMPKVKGKTDGKIIQQRVREYFDNL
jgi:uncharacterized protein YqeY